MSSTLTVHGSVPMEVFKPRFRMLVNGSEHKETPLYDFHVRRTRFSRADTASITCLLDFPAIKAANGDPWFAPNPPGADLPKPVEIELQVRDEAKQGATWAQVFLGYIDTVGLSYASRTITVECRDALSRLMDMRVADSWLNHTAKQLLETLVTAAGLTPEISNLSSMSGQYWQVEHKRVSQVTNTRFQTAYELARYIANTEGCDLYAEGKTIICKPFPKVGDGTKTHSRSIDIDEKGLVKSAVESVNFDRDFALAAGLVVHVLSWDSKQRTKHELWWSATGASRAAASNSGRLFSYKFTGMSLADLEKQAEAIYRNLSRHMIVGEMELPAASAVMQPREFITVSGTDWVYDNTYTIDSVQLTYDPRTGARQSIQFRLPIESSASISGDS